MTWFSDKLGKKFIFNPAMTRHYGSIYAISRNGYKGKPVMVIGFHGEPDKHLTYYTVQGADGGLARAYDDELTEAAPASTAISKEELGVANAIMVDKIKDYFHTLLDLSAALPRSEYVNGFKSCAEGAMEFIERLEAIRDGVITEEQQAAEIAAEGLQ